MHLSSILGNRVRSILLFSVFLAPTYAYSACSGGQDNSSRIGPFQTAEKFFERGAYVGVAALIDPFSRLPLEERKNISNTLEKFAPDGLKECIILQERKFSEHFESITYLYFDGEDEYLGVFLAAIERNGEWEILRAQMTQNFDELYSFFK